MKYSKSIITALTMAFIVLCLFAIIPTMALPSLQSKTTLVHTFTGLDLRGVDQTNNGSVFASVSGDLLRSDNLGVTWTTVYDGPAGESWTPFITTDDTIYFFAFVSGSLYNLYRSADYGLSWDLVFANCNRCWKFGQLSNGTILTGTYPTPSPNAALIYKSDDNGFTWEVFWNFTGQWAAPQHIHFLRVNPYNDDIWMGCGDTADAPYQYWNGTAWTTFYLLAVPYAYTDVLFDATYAYLLPDGSTGLLYRVPHKVTNANYVSSKEKVLDCGQAMYGAFFNGLMIVPNDGGYVYASGDQERWAQIYDCQHFTTNWACDSLTQRAVAGVWYFINDNLETLYRSTVVANDITPLYVQNTYVEYFGTVSTSDYQMPALNKVKIRSNITSYTPTQFKVSVIGMGKGNYAYNSGFESGTLANWTVGGVGQCQVTTANKYAGTYCLEINKSTTDSDKFWIESNSAINSLTESSEQIFVGLYAKANRTGLTYKFRVEAGYYGNGGVWIPWKWVVYTLSTSYTNPVSSTLNWYTSTPRHALKLRIYALTHTTYNYRYNIDNVWIERKASNYYAVGDLRYILPCPAVPTRGTIADYPNDAKLYSSNVNISIPEFPSAQNITVGALADGEQKDYIFNLAATTFDIVVAVGGSQQIFLIVMWSAPSGIFTTTDIVLGAAMIGVSTSALRWFWRRRKKSRTVSAP